MFTIKFLIHQKVPLMVACQVEKKAEISIRMIPPIISYWSSHNARSEFRNYVCFQPSEKF